MEMHVIEDGQNHLTTVLNVALVQDNTKHTNTYSKKHAECFFKQNLKTNYAAVKQY